MMMSSVFTWQKEILFNLLKFNFAESQVRNETIIEKPSVHR